MARKHNILTVLLLSAAPAAASPPAASPPAASPPARPAPPPDTAAGKQLLALRADLVRAGRAKAQAEIARFRPLCDKDGYPLVGNVASKGDRYQPSEFCLDVRKPEKRS